MKVKTIKSNKTYAIIAEVKTKSPFGYVSEKSWDDQFALVEEIGDIISIHTDERWAGSIDLIRKAKKMTGKSILAKGIHIKVELV